MPAPLPRSARLLGGLIGLLTRLLACTYRYRVHGQEHVDRLHRQRAMGIGLLLHNRIPCLSSFFSRPHNRPVAVLASRSRDGDLITAALQTLGFDAVRGSSSRGGGQALVQMQHYLRARPESLIAITVDGPRGPRGVCKAGGLHLAAQLPAPLLIAAAAADRAWIFRSWDRMLLPKPFARIGVVFLPPIALPAADERWRQKVENLLLRVNRCCSDKMGLREAPLRAVPDER